MTGIIITPNYVIADGLMVCGDTVMTTSGQKIGISTSNNPSLRAAPYVWGIMGATSDGSDALAILQESSQDIREIQNFPSGGYVLFIIQPGMNARYQDAPGVGAARIGYRVENGVPCRLFNHIGPVQFQGSAGDFLEAAYWGSGQDMAAAVIAAYERRTDFGGTITLIPLPAAGAPFNGDGPYVVMQFDLDETLDLVRFQAVIEKLEARG